MLSMRRAMPYPCSDRVERLKHHQVECPLKDFRLLRQHWRRICLRGARPASIRCGPCATNSADPLYSTGCPISRS